MELPQPAPARPSVISTPAATAAPRARVKRACTGRPSLPVPGTGAERGLVPVDQAAGPGLSTLRGSASCRSRPVPARQRLHRCFCSSAATRHDARDGEDCGPVPVALSTGDLMPAPKSSAARSARYRASYASRVRPQRAHAHQEPEQAQNSDLTNPRSSMDCHGRKESASTSENQRYRMLFMRSHERTELHSKGRPEIAAVLRAGWHKGRLPSVMDS